MIASPSLQITFAILASVGTALTIYFGYFRYKHYIWAKKKVQYDIFVRINQHSTNYFLKVATLLQIRKKNPKLAAKGAAVLIKYTAQCQEKYLFIIQKVVSKEMALYWIQEMREEWQTLANIDAEIVRELETHFSRKSPTLQTKWILHLEFEQNNHSIEQPDAENIYHLMMRSDS